MQSILNPNDVLTMIRNNTEAEMREKELEYTKIKSTAEDLLSIIKNNIQNNQIKKNISVIYDKIDDTNLYILEIRCFGGSIKKTDEEAINISDDNLKVGKYFKSLVRKSGFLYGEEHHMTSIDTISIDSAVLYLVLSEAQYVEFSQNITINPNQNLQDYYDKYLAVLYHYEKTQNQ